MLALELLSGAQKRCTSSRWPSKGGKTESRTASGSQGGHDGGRKLISTKVDNGKGKGESSKASSPKNASKGDGGKAKAGGKGEGFSEHGGTVEGGRIHTGGRGRKGSAKGRVSDASEEPLESKSSDEMHRKFVRSNDS